MRPAGRLVKKIDLIKLDGGVGRDAKKWVQPSISSRSDGIEILNPTSAEIYPDGAAFRHHPGRIHRPDEIGIPSLIRVKLSSSRGVLVMQES